MFWRWHAKGKSCYWHIASFSLAQLSMMQFMSDNKPFCLDLYIKGPLSQEVDCRAIRLYVTWQACTNNALIKQLITLPFNYYKNK